MAAALKNLIVWSDIPVRDLDRAIAFYGSVLDRTVTRDAFGGTPFGIIEHTEGNGACLILHGEKPSEGGMLTYFSVDGRIRAALAAVEAGGGTVLEPIHPIGPHGFRTVILDTEGNRLALHSTTDL